MLYGLRRFIYEGSRPSNWRKASKFVKKRYPRCSMCCIKKKLEAHDIIPYRFIKYPKERSFDFWVRNMLVLCRHDHMNQAHCGDMSGYSFNLYIKLLTEVVSSFRDYCREDLDEMSEM